VQTLGIRHGLHWLPDIPARLIGRRVVFLNPHNFFYLQFAQCLIYNADEMENNEHYPMEDENYSHYFGRLDDIKNRRVRNNPRDNLY
jgi:hypothetical protein